MRNTLDLSGLDFDITCQVFILGLQFCLKLLNDDILVRKLILKGFFCYIASQIFFNFGHNSSVDLGGVVLDVYFFVDGNILHLLSERHEVII